MPLSADTKDTPLLINLKQVEMQLAQLIIQFFSMQSQAGINLWVKDTPYTLQNGTIITLKNNVFSRERKEGHSGLRYELISNKPSLGVGTFGQVYKIKSTMSLDEDSIKIKKQRKDGKRRVVKIQRHHPSNPLTALDNEYRLTKKTAHLAVKKPTIVTNSTGAQLSFTTMNQLPGDELFYILDERENLSALQRIELSLALVNALEEQVCNQGIVHRDIKPENILVHLGPPIQIHFIDFGLSKDAIHLNTIINGTPPYLAPEVRQYSSLINFKADVFSLARVIALLWNVDYSTYDDLSVYFNATPVRMLCSIFSGIKVLDINAKRLIKDTLLGMLNLNPEARYSINQARVGFESAREIIKLNDKSPLNAHSLFRTHNRKEHNAPEEILVKKNSIP